MRSNRAPRKIKPGTFANLTGNLFLPFLVAIFVGIMIFLALLNTLGVFLALFWAGAPFFLTLLYMIFLVFNKPPGYQFDFLRSKFGRRYLKRKRVKFKREDLL